MTNKFYTLEQINEYINARIKVLSSRMTAMVKTLPPKKRELAYRKTRGRILELKHMQDIINHQTIRESITVGLSNGIGASLSEKPRQE